MSDKRGSRSNTQFDEDEGGCCYAMRIQSSLDDIQSLMFWKAVLAEFIGTFILVISAIGSTVQGWNKDPVNDPNNLSDPLDIVQIALSFGLSVATSVWIIGHVSGGHINPAVTVAMLVGRRVSVLRAILFILAQCLGSMAAAAALKAVTPEEQLGGLGCTTLNNGMTPGMGVGVELFITCFFILTVFASCDGKRTDLGGSFPLSIGFSIAIGHLWAVEYTGASMNPARSIGPAVAMKIWKDHWVYWVGPIAGGAIAALIYDNLLASNASIRRTRDCMLSSSFEDSEYPAVKASRDDDDRYETEAMHTNTV